MTPWIWPVGLAVLALAGASEASAAESGGRAGTSEAVDAEMLRDLDLLSSPDYARDREVARRMGFFERLRMLESQPAQEAASGPGPASSPPPPPPPRSAR
ncbi:MAG TPA: hypothetical protein VKA83_13490 [Methylomirabilota bacterium]|nr:hypothetical protein [Methylomirabilota bacterium]